MLKKINTTVCAALVIAVLACMLLAPQAMASGAPADSDRDAVTIAADGTASLFSSHMADEKVCSMQVSFTVPEGTVFAFDPGLGGRMTSTGLAGGVMTVYIASADPLLAPGQNTLTLGRFTPAEDVRPVEDSLAFVFGNRVVAQTLEVEQILLTPREALQRLVDEAKKVPEEEQKDPLVNALEKAESVLAQQDATEEQLDAAYQELLAALYGQASEVGTAKENLTAEIAAANQFVQQYLKEQGIEDPTKLYTQQTWEAFNNAMADAQQINERADATVEQIASARIALRLAREALRTFGQEALEAALAEAEGRLNDGKTYTDASRAALEAAIGAAQALGADAKEQQLLDAAAAITEAVSRLTEIASDPSDPLPSGNPDPEISDAPVVEPSDEPTAVPTTEPSAVPTTEPSAVPTTEPSAEPTAAPTQTPAATAAASVPSTGDETVLLPWLAVLCLACPALALILLGRRGRARR